MMAAENDAGSLVRGSTGRPSGAFEGSGLSGRSGFEQAMLMDTLTYLPDDLLTKVDRASMAVSLEARVPFLDPAVFEFAWRLHPDDRVRDGRGKWVVRRLLHRHVPAELVERPKMGFGIPVGEWLRGPLRLWADDLLEPSLLAEQGYLDPVGVTDRWRAHRDQGDDLVFQLWPILMFQAWLSEEAS
jgi:asparagine synthase (glutamine-hydrolysing)